MTIQNTKRMAATTSMPNAISAHCSLSGNHSVRAGLGGVIDTGLGAGSRYGDSLTPEAYGETRARAAPYPGGEAPHGA